MAPKSTGDDHAEKPRDKIDQPHHSRASSFNEPRPRRNVSSQNIGRQSDSSLTVPQEPARRARSADPGPKIHSGGNERNNKTISGTSIKTSSGTDIQAPKIGSPSGRGLGLEDRKNLTRQDFRRAVTKASKLSDSGQTREAADMLLQALLWDHIKDLPLTDPDTVLAREHLAVCYFDLGDYRRAEDFSRQALKAREASKPRNNAHILAARQKLVAALLETANQKKDNQELKKADEIYNEALSLSVRNVYTEKNPRLGEDVDDVLECCGELLGRKKIPLEERIRLLKTQVRALVKCGNGSDIGELQVITDARWELVSIYIQDMKDRKQGDEVHAAIHSSIAAFRLTIKGRNSRDFHSVLELENEIKTKWSSLIGFLASERWKRCLKRVCLRVRRDILPRKEEIRLKWYRLSRRLIARKRWKILLRRISRRSKRRIDERRLAAIDKWQGLAQQLLTREREKEEEKKKEEQKRLQEEENKKQEKEKKRKEEEKKRKEEEKKRKEEEKKRKEEREKRRKEKEEEDQRKAKEEVETKRKAKEEEDRRKAREDEDRRKAQEEEDRRKAQEEQEKQEKEAQDLISSLQQGLRRIDTGYSEASEAEMTSALDSNPILFDARLSPDSSRESNEWIQKFISFRKRILPRRFDDTVERTRLTIIDTGLDETHPFVKKKRWQRCRPYTNTSLYKDFESGLDTPVDEDGHGTFIAGIVLRLAPDVELSVARIGRTHSTMKRDANVEKKIAEALQHAIYVWDTDIISMSFGFDENKSGELRSAMNVARKTNIILLGAAGNFGNTRADVSYPARVDGVFKIFASDHTGYASNISPQVSKSSDYCFSTLGCNVESIWPSGLRQAAEKMGLRIIEKANGSELWTTMSGTSFAAPIAASLVAIIYQFYSENIDLVRLPEKLAFKSPDVVKAILLKMSMAPKQDRYNYLNPTSGRESFFLYHGGVSKVMPMDQFFGGKLTEAIYHAGL